MATPFPFVLGVVAESGQGRGTVNTSSRLVLCINFKRDLIFHGFIVEYTVSISMGSTFIALLCLWVTHWVNISFPISKDGFPDTAVQLEIEGHF